jgi:hypothetical protein
MAGESVVGTVDYSVASTVATRVAEKENYWAALMAGDWASTTVAEMADR